MEYRKFGNHYVVRIEKGEEVLSKLKELCLNENIRLGSISGLGAANEVEIGLFNTETKEYKTTVMKGMFEITSLIGNITRKDDEVYLHCHINFSDASLQTFGGHLVSVKISATSEIIVTAIDGEVNRRFDENIGLILFDFSK